MPFNICENCITNLVVKVAVLSIRQFATVKHQLGQMFNYFMIILHVDIFNNVQLHIKTCQSNWIGIKYHWICYKIALKFGLSELQAANIMLWSCKATSGTIIWGVHDIKEM